MNRVCSIERLLLKWNPCAIFWAVISIYINSFNCKIIFVIRSFNPIGKINIIIPCVTNFYSSTTIIFKITIFKILTTLTHTLPNFVSSRIRFIMFSKSFSSPTRPTVKTLITFIGSAFKNARASLASKFKISSVFISIHSPIIQRLG